MTGTGSSLIRRFMSKGLTLEHFDEVMGAIKLSFNSVETRLGSVEANMVTKDQLEALATKDQIKLLPTKADVEEIVHKVTQTMRSDFSALQTSVDRYTKRTEDWHQEQFALKNRVGRLEKTLVRKNVLSENDLLTS